MNVAVSEIMNKDWERQQRDSAASIMLHLENGETVFETISRPDGLYFITEKRILRLRTPDDLDPNLSHNEVPWEQSVFLPHGASDPLIARTIIQTMRIAEIFFSKKSEQYNALQDISWEVMSSLVSLRFIKERLENQINDIIEIVKKDSAIYTQGQSPKPLPIVEYYDIEFRSFANEVRRTLNAISELFMPLAGENFSGGKFDKARDWAAKVRGENSVLACMLANDQRWIKVWIEVRTAIEHPKKDKFIEVLNFSLEANRNIRLPTWRLIHPDFDMTQPQNLLDVFEICINNLLKFFEDIQITLTDGHLPSKFKVVYEEILEGDRNPNLPMRYNFYPLMSGESR